MSKIFYHRLLKNGDVRMSERKPSGLHVIEVYDRDPLDCQRTTHKLTRSDGTGSREIKACCGYDRGPKLLRAIIGLCDHSEAIKHWRLVCIGVTLRQLRRNLAMTAEQRIERVLRAVYARNLDEADKIIRQASYEDAIHRRYYTDEADPGLYQSLRELYTLCQLGIAIKKMQKDV